MKKKWIISLIKLTIKFSTEGLTKEISWLEKWNYFKDKSICKLQEI